MTIMAGILAAEIEDNKREEFLIRYFKSEGIL